MIYDQTTERKQILNIYFACIFSIKENDAQAVKNKSSKRKSKLIGAV